MQLKQPPALFIIGPTASGKTGLAIKLMKYFPIELISVDSALVYKGMDVGTAKPSERELQEAPHRLISFLDPSEPYSAAEFRKDALREMDDITSKGKIPVLVGGTMLYFRALEYGLAKLPEANQNVREELTAMANEYGWGFLHEELKKVDPVSASRIHPNDKQRIQRALEVYRLTNKSLTEHQKDAQMDALPYKLMKIALIPKSREWIRDLAEIRFNKMLENDLIEEVARLYKRGDLNSDLPAMRSVGYRQVWEYLDGKIDFEEMKERAIIATRQLAKRQMTWMRSEKNITPYNAKDYELEKIVADIRHFLEKNDFSEFVR